MPQHRLGDVIDDFCVKCRRLTNHSVVSLLNGSAAKVRCRTCHSDHDYRHELCHGSDGDIWQCRGDQRCSDKWDADHGDHAGGECGRGDGDGDQCRWPEREFAQRIHLCGGTADGEQRVSE